MTQDELPSSSGGIPSLVMKQLYASPDSARVALIRSMLEAADIPFEVRNEAPSQAMMGIPFSSEVWVDDKDYDDAIHILKHSHPA